MELMEFGIYAVVCSVLLGAPSINCLSLHKRDGFPQTNGELDSKVTSTSKPYVVTSLNTTQPTPGDGQSNPASPPTFSRNSTTSDGVSENQDNVPSSSAWSQDTSAGVLGLNPVEKETLPMEFRILTTSTTGDLRAATSPPGETTEPSQAEDGKNTTINESHTDSLSKVNLVEMLTTSSRISVHKAGDDLVTSAGNVPQPPEISSLDNAFKADASPGITPVTTSSSSVSDGWEISTLSPGDIRITGFPFPAVTEEWDDAKITPVHVSLNTQSDIIASHDTTTHTTDAGTEVTSGSPSPAEVTLPAESGTGFSLSEGVGFTAPHENISRDFLEPNVSVEPIKEVLAATAPDTTASQKPGSPLSYTGVPLQTSEVAGRSEVNVTAAVMKEVTPEETTRGFNASDRPGEAEPGFSDSSTTAEVLHLETDEADKAVTTVTSAAMSSQMTVMAPPAIPVSATSSDGLEKPDSEEGDEEDDEEEEDDEDDEDEEEDDKYTDSINESVEGDSDLPPFTLPGLVSQESIEDKDNVVLMDRPAYPDTQEWEQQNQGLVRSWMEKLKDKAGYMTGMLAPVGVGIGGALTILAVLYSIKIINRRRRNGFKQHKRKPREFNSMQDRVMLLADSSEDEF